MALFLLTFIVLNSVPIIIAYDPSLTQDASSMPYDGYAFGVYVNTTAKEIWLISLDTSVLLIVYIMTSFYCIRPKTALWLDELCIYI